MIDVKNILKNYAAIITILVLSILPSLYAWFNIEASWDPYAKEATSQIKIGVINNDSGASLRGESINFGDKVVESLKENTLMGWEFFNEDEGVRLLEKGEIYATITINTDFSKDMISVLTNEVKKPKITYRVNEKLNAIAPKLTIKGATGIQENIDKTLVETISNILLTETKNIGIELEDAKPKISSIYNLLKEVQLKFTDLNQTIDLATDGVKKVKDLSKEIKDDMPLMQETLSNSKNLTSDVKEFLYTTQNTLRDLSPSIKEDISLSSKISNNISEYCDLLIQSIQDNDGSSKEIIENLINKADNLDISIKSLIKLLKSLNQFSPKLDKEIKKLEHVDTSIVSLKATLESINEAINLEEEPSLPVLNNLKTFADNINNICSDLYNTYDTNIKDKINDIFNEAYNTSNNILSILSEAENNLPAVNNLLTTAYEGTDSGIDILNFAKEKLPLAEDSVNILISKMDEISNSEEFNSLIELLKNDISETSDFVSNPVDLIQESIFPMANYGSAMTPFYTTLSLWTGVLFLVSLLSVNIHGKSYKDIQVYFGRLLLFLTIAIIQAIIVSLGNLYLLKIYCLNPSLFVLTSILTSILFTIIIYTFCSVLGNAGKVICIVLLVFQIGGSGGTFPIELTPKFFQTIHPFLPFTYTISLMRETIGGIVKSIVQEDLLVINLYIVVSIIIGSILKRPFSKLINSFTNKFHESNLDE